MEKKSKKAAYQQAKRLMRWTRTAQFIMERELCELSYMQIINIDDPVGNYTAQVIGHRELENNMIEITVREILK